MAKLLLALLVCLCACGVAAYNNGVGATPPMGWNTWCTDDFCGARDICTETEIRNVADTMVKNGMRDLGYIYINLDDCWCDDNRTASGELQPDPTNFPSGMPALADYIHSLGMKLGLYTCVGTQTCRRGRPGSFGHYEQDADTLAGWGVDFVKADNCNRPSGWTETDLYSNFSAALNSTGRPILFSLCEWGDDDVYAWGHQYGQMFRVQMDHLPFWHFPPAAAGEGYGQGTHDIIEYMAFLKPSTIVKQYGWMDPDFLETLFIPTMSYTDSRTEFSFWTLWSAPLICATDVRYLPARHEILTNADAIAIDQDSLNTGGDRLLNNTDGGQVWGKPLSNGDWAVILYNSHNFDIVKVTVEWTMLGWPSDASVLMYNIWDHKNEGPETGSYTATILPHDIVYLRCTLQQ